MLIITGEGSSDSKLSTKAFNLDVRPSMSCIPTGKSTPPAKCRPVTVNFFFRFFNYSFLARERMNKVSLCCLIQRQVEEKFKVETLKVC